MEAMEESMRAIVLNFSQIVLTVLFFAIRIAILLA
jgi:hypothetical protein